MGGKEFEETVKLDNPLDLEELDDLDEEQNQSADQEAEKDR